MSCCQPAPPGEALPPASSCCAPPKATAPIAAPAPVVETVPAVGWKAYLPLLVILGTVGLAASALQLSLPPDQRSLMLAMSQFMGLFLLVFSMFKLFDLPGFARGFAKYDLAAGAVKPYGYVYPFLELGFGLALLAGWQLFAVNAALAGLMFFGAAGVLRSLARGENLRCACLGSMLNVPLSTVAVVEDLGMGVMSLLMLGMLP